MSGSSTPEPRRTGSGARNATTGRRELVGRVSDFPPGRIVVRTLAAGREVGVLRSADGEYFAIRNRCPHMGARLCAGDVSGTWLPSAPGERRYGLHGRVLRCPWHGWEFDLRTGQTLFGIAGQRVRVYDVVVEEDHVYIVM